MRRNQIQICFQSIAFFDAVVAVLKNVDFSARILIEKIVSENVHRKSDFFDSIRRVSLPKIKKGLFRQHFSTAVFDSIRNGIRNKYGLLV